jgi:predicted nucleic acid-binding Zn ribbon protein
MDFQLISEEEFKLASSRKKRTNIDEEIEVDFSNDKKSIIEKERKRKSYSFAIFLSVFLLGGVVVYCYAMMD